MEGTLRLCAFLVCLWSIGQNACRMFQNAYRLFQNACRMFQNACRMIQNAYRSQIYELACSIRMFQNILECIQIYELACRSMSLHAVI